MTKPYTRYLRNVRTQRYVRRTSTDRLYGFAVGRCWLDQAYDVPGWRSRLLLTQARQPGLTLRPDRRRCWGRPGPRRAPVTMRGWRLARAARTALALGRGSQP